MVRALAIRGCGPGCFHTRGIGSWCRGVGARFDSTRLRPGLQIHIHHTGVVVMRSLPPCSYVRPRAYRNCPIARSRAGPHRCNLHLLIDRSHGTGPIRLYIASITMNRRVGPVPGSPHRVRTSRRELTVLSGHPGYPLTPSDSPGSSLRGWSRSGSRSRGGASRNSLMRTRSPSVMPGW